MAQRADDAYSDLTSMKLERRRAGLSQKAIADRLNSGGHVTRRGKPWNQVQVMRVLARFGWGPHTHPDFAHGN